MGLHAHASLAAVADRDRIRSSILKQYNSRQIDSEVTTGRDCCRKVHLQRSDRRWRIDEEMREGGLADDMTTHVRDGGETYSIPHIMRV